MILWYYSTNIVYSLWYNIMGNKAGGYCLNRPQVRLSSHLSGFSFLKSNNPFTFHPSHCLYRCLTVQLSTDRFWGFLWPLWCHVLIVRGSCSRDLFCHAGWWNHQNQSLCHWFFCTVRHDKLNYKECDCTMYIDVKCGMYVLFLN